MKGGFIVLTEDAVYVKGYDEVTDPRLGRIVEHDPRSLAYRAVVNPASVTIQSVRHQRYIPILDQGNLGSCTGNATVGAAGTGALYEAIKDVLAQKNIILNEDLAVKLYSRATALDSFPGNYPPDDTGSSGLAVAKAAVEAGLISGYKHVLSFDELLAALQTDPVIIGVNWYNAMFNPDTNGVVRVPAGDKLAGGHEFVLDEIDMNHQLIGASNSWGLGWGVQGRFYIPFDLMKRLLSENGDVTVLVPVTAPAPIPTPSPIPPSPVPPAPTPTPVPPTPSPEPPTPNSPVADTTLWGEVKDWVGKHHTHTTRPIADALEQWAKDKGLAS